MQKPIPPDRWLREELKARLHADVYQALMVGYSAQLALYRRWQLARSNRRTLEGLLARRPLVKTQKGRADIDRRIATYQARILQDLADGYTTETLK